MYNNNLILDFNDQIKIKQNEKIFFNFQSNILFKNSLQIEIKAFEHIDMIDLYLIIKSYINNLQYAVSSFLIVIENKDEKSFTANNVNIHEFKNLSYYGFIDWIYQQLIKDWKYMNLESKYYFVFSYKIKIFDFKLIKFLRPQYPWNSNLIEKFTKLKNDEEYYIKTIEQLKQEANVIKKENKKLSDEIALIKNHGK